MILYWSCDDGAFYQPHEVDSGTEDGAFVDNYEAWRVEDAFTLTAEDLAIGQNDLLQMLLIHNPPLAVKISG